jgi:hypothetical protein
MRTYRLICVLVVGYNPQHSPGLSICMRVCVVSGSGFVAYAEIEGS